jgi:nitrogen fixation protein FixH
MISKFFSPEKGTWVFLSFLSFFGVIVLVNTVFITTALTTHSGVVTKQPYEKGLAYNDILKTALAQPDLEQKALFEDGILRWSLKDEAGDVVDAKVTARLVRPVDDGLDFEVVLTQISSGVYETDLELPIKGSWEALLRAEWKTQIYQTRFSLIAK